MTVTAVFGVHWGDEGKGKIVDVMAKDYNIVARWNGGDNAGHTVVTDEYGRVALHLVPSGILHKGKVSVIGNGEVVNLQSLLNEIEGLKEKSVEVTPDSLVLSDRAHLILPYYRDIEAKKESTRKIGTTGRGIGVAYTFKPDRVGARVLDLLDSGGSFIEKVKIHAEENRLRLNPEELLESQRELLGRLEHYLNISDTVEFFGRNGGANILLEGAQGVLLDIDAGTYPYVTSSNASPGGAYTGCLGIPRIDRFIGVMKAPYVTRVGAGPFPTELGTEEAIKDARRGQEEITAGDMEKIRRGDPLATAKYLRVRGGEYGTTTERPRRNGWQDLVAAKYAFDVSGNPSHIGGVMLALTKLDVADGLPQINVCTAYRRGDKNLPSFPSDTNLLNEVEPIYEELEGWSENTKGVTRYDKLPRSAQNLARFLENSLHIPVYMISTGPNRKEVLGSSDGF